MCKGTQRSKGFRSSQKEKGKKKDWVPLGTRADVNIQAAWLGASAVKRNGWGGGCVDFCFTVSSLRVSPADLCFKSFPFFLVSLIVLRVFFFRHVAGVFVWQFCWFCKVVCVLSVYCCMLWYFSRSKIRRMMVVGRGEEEGLSRFLPLGSVSGGWATASRSREADPSRLIGFWSRESLEKGWVSWSRDGVALDTIKIKSEKKQRSRILKLNTWAAFSLREHQASDLQPLQKYHPTGGILVQVFLPTGFSMLFLNLHGFPLHNKD